MKPNMLRKATPTIINKTESTMILIKETLLNKYKFAKAELVHNLDLDKANPNPKPINNPVMIAMGSKASINKTPIYNITLFKFLWYKNEDIVN
jgi:hypothetical protein